MAYVDVYYGEQRLASTLAVYTDRRIRFQAPEDFLFRLPETHDPTFLNNFFNGEVELNRPGVCAPQAAVDCFELKGERIVLSFDPNEFRVDLFLAPTLLTLQRLEGRGFLPPVRGRPSYLAALNAVYAGNSSQLQPYRDSYNLAADQVISTGSDRLHIYSGYNPQEQLYFRDIAYVHEFEGNRVTAGRYDIRGDRLLPGTLAWGIGVESTTDLRLDLEQSGASRLEVFLPRDARVDIYRDGRLLSSRHYGLGNRQLDVSELPEGAYEVSIQVIADGVLLREEQQYFVKSTKLPPVGENQFSFDMGRAVDQFELRPEADSGFIRFGYARRLAPSHFLNLRSLATPQWRSLQAVHSWILPGWLGEIGGQFADDGYYAHDVSSSWQAGGVGTFSLSWFKARAASGVPLLDSERPIFRRSAASSEQLALRHSLYRQRWSVYSTVRSEYSRGERATSVATTLNVYPLSQSRELQLSLSMSESDKAGFQGNLELQWQFPVRNNNYRLRSRVASGRDTDNENSAGVTGRKDQWLGGELRYELTANAQRDRNSLFGQGDYRGSAFRSALGGSAEVGGGRARSLSASLGTALTTADGRLQLFASEGATAGVVASLPGDTKHPAEIVINDRRKVRVQAGTSQFIVLEPYQQYSLRLNPLSADALVYDSSERLVTLYPGRVPVLEWRGRRLIPAFGQISVPSLAEGAWLQLSSDNGRDAIRNGEFFALDVDANTDTLVVSHGGEELCRFDLAQQYAESGAVADLGELYCEP